MMPTAFKDHGHNPFLDLTSKMRMIFLQDSSHPMTLTMMRETFSAAFSIEGKEEKQMQIALFPLSLIVMTFSRAAFPHPLFPPADLAEPPSQSAPPLAQCTSPLSQKRQNSDNKEDHNNEIGRQQVGDRVDHIERQEDRNQIHPGCW